MKALPPWAALGLAGAAGVASAAQSAANAGLGERVGNAALGAVVNTVGGAALVLVGLLVIPSMRAGLSVLRRTPLPWWAYLGGLGGAGFVVLATYVVPVLGVAVFTIAQVAGNSFGGLAVDRAGLAPAGRLALTGPRILGALLGLAAVVLAQAGRPVGELAVGPIVLAACAGLAVALQSALNGRVSAAVGAPAGTAVNFALATPGVLAVAAAAGVIGSLGAARWPGEWYLYVGGPLGLFIVVVLLVSVRSVGVLRTGLAMVGGQLAGALLLDAVRLGGLAEGLPVLAGAVLTLLAVLVSGRAARTATAGGAPTAAEVARAATAADAPPATAEGAGTGAAGGARAATVEGGRTPTADD